MIVEVKLAGSVCRIKCGEQQGTGFFISESTILTCYHVVAEHMDNAIELRHKQNEIKVGFRAHCDKNDFAILDVLDGESPAHFLALRQSTLVADIDWKSFGHPANSAGTSTGEPLNGIITYVVPEDEVCENDITCSVAANGARNPTYQGFSGSPIVNFSGEVIGVLRFQGSNNLHGVSIKKAASFLSAQGIALLADELDGFESYATAAFEGYESGVKQLCSAYAADVAKANNPTQVINALMGKVYYPAEADGLETLIANMKKDAPTSSLLWRGWLELLSHVALLRGEHQDVNALTITLPAEKVSRWMGLGRATVPGRKLQLRFFWTGKEQYFEVLRDYLHSKSKLGLEKNTCHIFNAKSANFGGGNLKPNFKSNIISSVSSPHGAGPSIMGDIKYGLLSLRHLHDEVKHCSTLEEATKNLEKLFKDAVEQS